MVAVDSIPVTGVSELVLEVVPGEREALEALVRREMAGAAQLSVPLEVSVGFGESWDAAAH